MKPTGASSVKMGCAPHRARRSLLFRRRLLAGFEWVLGYRTLLNCLVVMEVKVIVAGGLHSFGGQCSQDH